MSLSIREAVDAADLRAFVDLPFTLYKGEPYWVPPLKDQEFTVLRPETNPAFAFCEVKWWLAHLNGQVVGRVGGIINSLWNEKAQEKTARFSRLEFVDDGAVCKALLNTVEDWARSRGMTHIEGPLGFTNLDSQGLLIEGFDHLPPVASVYHLPYYGHHVAACGYGKQVDWVEFRLTISEIPEKAARLNDLIKERFGLKLVECRDRGDLLRHADEIFNLFNTSFAEVHTVVPLNRDMMKFYADKYLSFLNPGAVKLIKDAEDVLVGFIIGLPSLSGAMQKANGSLWPLGWWYLKRAMEKPRVIDLILTGVDPKMQAKGVPAILIAALQQWMLDTGVKYAETTGIFETNEKAIRVWKNYAHIQHRRKRAYVKELR